MSSDRFEVTAIGFAHTEFEDPATTPVQAALNPDCRARIDVDDSFCAALADLGGFSHAWLVTWLGDGGERAQPLELRPVPFLLQRSARRVGLFATRTPRRPNPIGLSLVRIEQVVPPSVFVRGVDFVDGTPVLDIKPYVGAFDVAYGGPTRCGWFDTVALPGGATPDGLRPDISR